MSKLAWLIWNYNNSWKLYLIRDFISWQAHWKYNFQCVALFVVWSL